VEIFRLLQKPLRSSLPLDDLLYATPVGLVGTFDNSAPFSMLRD
jgi:hypothetical protein